jgi:hypothetical protein
VAIEHSSIATFSQIASNTRQRYLTAFDIQSILELASEAILHEWPTSGTLLSGHRVGGTATIKHALRLRCTQLGTSCS